MNADGSGRQNLTPNTANSNSFPDWSPDGSKIIFTNRFSSQDAGTLRRYDFSTSQSEVLVSNAYRGFWGRF
jgi:Tol biopolymer transport system component